MYTDVQRRWRIQYQARNVDCDKLKKKVDSTRSYDAKLGPKYKSSRLEAVKDLRTLSSVRIELISKLSELDTVRHDWATERANFLSEALREHDLISAERNADFSRLIFLKSDFG